jgi:KipI family sensor histidine kinase inhibitor
MENKNRPSPPDTIGFRIMGDRGLLVEYGHEIDDTVNRRVRTVAAAVARKPPDGVLETVPAYRSLLIIYDPLVTTIRRLIAFFRQLEERIDRIDIPPPRTVDIPVCYGGEYGPDMDFVARSHSLTTEQVIRLHTGRAYTVCMIGFSPGFPFLGGLDPQLETPRLKTPRTRVPRGSVAIANNQTGIYPLESPGGWQVIGRTPLNLFDPDGEPPLPYQTGDRIRFTSVSAREYHRIREAQVP